MHIVLYQPQIPQNTGNIVRTASVTGCSVALVPPFGFSIASRHLKRAGLDYWEGVDFSIEENLEAALDEKFKNEEGKGNPSFYFFSSRGKKLYTSVSYRQDTWLIFGSETQGLPASLLEKWPERTVYLPQIPGTRCLNLATAAGIGIYEAWKQTGFYYEPR